MHRQSNPTDTREILRHVQQVEIRTRRHVNDALVGAYHSVFKGRGIDFSEVREYLPGDDVRAIDWNLTARAGRPYLKIFQEERELTLILAVDLSRSGQFGSDNQSKRELAAELASVLALSAIRNNDKVGLLLFTDSAERFIPPRKGRRHVLRVIREILFFRPQRRGTSLREALEFLNRVQKRRAIVFFLSDFLSPEVEESGSGQTVGRPFRNVLALTARHHDFIAVDLHDPREAELPDVGLIALEDAESGAYFEIDTRNPEVRENYRRQNRDRRARLHRLFRQIGIDRLSVVTGEPYITALRLFFVQRERRR